MQRTREVLRAKRLDHAVSRDMHKMRAFVRFREVPEGDGTRHVAWFEPEHYIVEANAGFFARRFATMRWSILTPYRSAHWDGETLAFGPGATRADIAARRRHGGILAHLFHQHLQPGPPQGRGDDGTRCRAAIGGTCPRPRRYRN